MNGDDANTGDDNARESNQRQQGLRQRQQGRRRRVESIWVERDSTQVDGTTATTVRRQRAAFLQWLQSFALSTATDSHVGSGQGSFLSLLCVDS